MSEAKHTPGPWMFVPAGGVAWNEYPIVQRQSAGGFQVVDADKERATADARLIAAAPELLEALQALMIINDEGGPFGGEIYLDRVDRAWDNARAAIAKARGEAQ